MPRYRGWDDHAVTDAPGALVRAEVLPYQMSAFANDTVRAPPRYPATPGPRYPAPVPRQTTPPRQRHGPRPAPGRGGLAPSAPPLVDRACV
jgi:hypothetical protein